MSLGQKLRRDLEDGRQIEVAYDGRDLRAWESEHKKSALVESMSVGMLTWLGHHAGVRTGEIDGELKDYKAFDEVCISVEGLRPPGVAGPYPGYDADQGFPQESWGRILCALMVRTGIPVSVLEGEDEEVILTVIDLLSRKED